MVRQWKTARPNQWRSEKATKATMMRYLAIGLISGYLLTACGSEFDEQASADEANVDSQSQQLDGCDLPPGCGSSALSTSAPAS